MYGGIDFEGGVNMEGRYWEGQLYYSYHVVGILGLPEPPGS